MRHNLEGNSSLGEQEELNHDDDLLCPITQELIQDPVLAADGHTYERAAITAWLEKRGGRAVSPMTGQRLVHKELLPNFLVKKLIAARQEQQAWRERKSITERDLLVAIRLREEELDAKLAKHAKQVDEAKQARADMTERFGPLAEENQRLRAELDRLQQTPATSREDQTFTPIPLQDEQLVSMLNEVQQLAQVIADQRRVCAANIIQCAFACYATHRALSKTTLVQEAEDLQHQLVQLRATHEQRIQKESANMEEHLRGQAEQHAHTLSQIRSAIAQANEAENDDEIVTLTQQRRQLQKQQQEERRELEETWQQQRQETQASYEKRKSVKEAALQQVITAKGRKRRELLGRAERIEQFTQSIESQKQTLAENFSAQQQKVEALSDHVKKQKAAFTKYLSSSTFEDAARCIKPQTPDQQVTQQSQTVIGKYVKPDEATKFLDWIQEGHLVEVENNLKRNAHLAHAQADVPDRFKRNQTFKQITALQYAYWALDIEMCELILNYLEKADAAIQLQALPEVLKRASQNVRNYTKDDRFDLSIVVAKYQVYKKLLDAERWDECDEFWPKQVGGAQRQFPAWLVYAMCEEGQDVAWTKKDFTRKVERQYVMNHFLWMFEGTYNSGLLGNTWAARRGTNPTLFRTRPFALGLFSAGIHTFPRNDFYNLRCLESRRVLTEQLKVSLSEPRSLAHQ